MLILGLDVGTTTLCGALMDSDSQEAVATCTRVNDSEQTPACSYEKIQNPVRILEVARQIIEELSGRGEPIAIGVTGQMHGILYLDGAGRAVSPLYTWQDGRGGELGHDGRSYAQRIAQATETVCAPGYGLATHLFNLEHGLVPAQAVSLCTIGDYLAMTLAGRSTPLLEGSVAASLGGYRAQDSSFCREQLAALGIAPDFLPEVVSGGGLLGGTIPVACACGDHQASFLAAVPHPDSQVAVNIGTGSQVSVFSSEYIPALGIEIRPYFGSGYLYTGASINGGCIYRTLRDFFKQCCTTFGGASDQDFYAVMNRLADDGQPCTLIADVSLNGSRQCETTGSVRGITTQNFTPGQLIKAFLSGMAAELGDFYKQMPDRVKVGKTQLALSGNGVRQNPALRRCVEEAFGLPSVLVNRQEEAACGAALAALQTITEMRR